MLYLPCLTEPRGDYSNDIWDISHNPDSAKGFDRQILNWAGGCVRSHNIVYKKWRWVRRIIFYFCPAPLLIYLRCVQGGGQVSKDIVDMKIFLLILFGLLTFISWTWMISILSKDGYEENKIVNDRRYLLMSIPTMIVLIIAEKNKRLKTKYVIVLVTSIISVIGLLTTFFLTIPI